MSYILKLRVQLQNLFTAKGTLEEVNKEVKIEVPEESKKAKEMGS